MDVALGQQDTAKLLNRNLVGKHVLEVLLGNLVLHVPVDILESLLLVDDGLHIGHSSRDIRYVGFELKIGGHLSA